MKRCRFMLGMGIIVRQGAVRRAVAPLLCCLILAGGFLMLARPAEADEHAPSFTISGYVRNSHGEGIGGATVEAAIVRQAGGGATLDIGVHMFHGVRYLCGEVATMSALVRTFEPARYLRSPAGDVLETVAADADDAYFSLFELAGGGIGMASFTWAGHGEPTGLPDGRVIYGTRGAIKGGRLLQDGREPVGLDTVFEREASAAVKERFFPLGLTDTFALGAYDFFRAIEQGAQMEASGEEGLRDVAVAFAMVEASHARQVVRVEDVLAGRIAAAQRPINEYYGL